MSEPAFHNEKIVKHPFQDPVGNDAHQGLERFLDKFHQPGIPTHTLITDAEYHVFLWFHDAVGNLIYCPYTLGRLGVGKNGRMMNDYVPRLVKDSPSRIMFDQINSKINDGYGIQSGVDPRLPDKCLDLTPFVRQAQLPEIAPAGADKIHTLFGDTQGGAFSPYASDGSKPITLTVLDTEFCILDAIFLPWMKDINSPWWYRPDKAFTEWATPYPMATLEVQRPRMRFAMYGKDGESRQTNRDQDYYNYYSYKFIGVKPTSYAAFEVNATGVSNLTRTLTMTCDMCIVDIYNDLHIQAEGSHNLGSTRKFIFDNAPVPSSDDDGSDENELPDFEKDMEDARRKAEAANRDASNNGRDIGQQGRGDQPGDDIPERTPEQDDQDQQDQDDANKNPARMDTDDEDKDSADKVAEKQLKNRRKAYELAKKFFENLRGAIIPLDDEDYFEYEYTDSELVDEVTNQINDVLQEDATKKLINVDVGNDTTIDELTNMMLVNSRLIEFNYCKEHIDNLVEIANNEIMTGVGLIGDLMRLDAIDGDLKTLVLRMNVSPTPRPTPLQFWENKQQMEVA